MAATDPGNWWKSTDGKNWALDSGGHGSNEVVNCNGTFTAGSACSMTVQRGDVAFGQGVWIRVNGTRIERSTNGTTWSPVLTSSSGLNAVAFGVIP